MIAENAEGEYAGVVACMPPKLVRSCFERGFTNPLGPAAGRVNMPVYIKMDRDSLFSYLSIY